MFTQIFQDFFLDFQDFQVFYQNFQDFFYRGTLIQKVFL